MKTSQVAVASQTFSRWIPVDQAQNAFGLGFSVTLTPAASLTYSVQHTSDSLGRTQNATISRSGTTATVNLPGHGASVGDFIKVVGANVLAGDPFDGEFAVASIVDANNLTYTVANTGSTEAALDARVVLCRVRPHPTLVAQTASADGSYQFPYTAVRISVTVWTSGTATLTINQGRK